MKLAQRTLVRMMEVLSGTRIDNPSRLLYEHNFPDWFVVHAGSHYRFSWDEILITLRNGKFFFPDTGYFGMPNDNITGKYLDKNEALNLGEMFVQKLAALATTMQNGESVANALQLDGYAVNLDRLTLVPLEGLVSAKHEESGLTALAKLTAISNEAIILKHIADANNLFIDRKYHPSLNESRNALQALIDNISGDTDQGGAHSTKLPGGTKSRIEYLSAVGFLTSDEEAAVKSAWGALSAGSHPGVPEMDESRIGLILALEFAQLLLLKYENWKKNSFKKFSR